MLTMRVIARLDVKGPKVVKGIQMEGLRVVGFPAELAKQYEDQGADEILYVDIVASLYGRDPQWEVIDSIADVLSIPLTVVGGIQSVEDVRRAMRCGADKVGINTMAMERPVVIRECAQAFGSQAIVASLDADAHGRLLTHGGRNVVPDRRVEEMGPIREAQGAGELLLTWIWGDGRRIGGPVEMVRRAAPVCGIPLIAGGGIGTPEDAVALLHAGASGIVVGTYLHSKQPLQHLKDALEEAGFPVRR